MFVCLLVCLFVCLSACQTECYKGNFPLSEELYYQNVNLKIICFSEKLLSDIYLFTEIFISNLLTYKITKMKGSLSKTFSLKILRFFYHFLTCWILNFLFLISFFLFTLGEVVTSTNQMPVGDTRNNNELVLYLKIIDSLGGTRPLNVTIKVNWIHQGKQWN